MTAHTIECATSEITNPFIKECSQIQLGDTWKQGAFGTVHVIETSSGRFAVKRVFETRDFVNRELDVCCKLAFDDHPNIVKIFGNWCDSVTLEMRQFNLVMEFMPDTLNSVLTNLALREMRMKTTRVVSFMLQLAGALKHLETIQLMHRDLKPDNILVNIATDQLKLADFGSAKFVLENQPSETYICSRFYRAPELILDRNIYTTSIDIWSFGCIFGEFAKGRPLFTGSCQVDVLASIMKCRGMVTIADIADMATLNTCVINSDCISKIDTKRVGPKPWSSVFRRKINSKHVLTSYGATYEDILDSCLQWNPKNRPTASSLVEKAFFGPKTLDAIKKYDYSTTYYVT